MSLHARPVAAATDTTPHIASGVPKDLLVRALAATSEISLITDAEQNILHASSSFTTITGYSEQEVLGNNCRILQGPGTSPEVVGTIRDTLARGEKFQGDILNYRKDGSPFWNALKVTPLLDGEGRATHFVSVQRDVTTRMALHEQLRFQATHDALTGLPNRAALDAHLAKALEADGGRSPSLAVGLLDLDGFRDINNALGHGAGDEVLAGWAARMQARLLPREFLARMGADEFVLVIEDVAETDAQETLAAVLRRLGGSIESAFDAGGQDVRVMMSAGLALHRGTEPSRAGCCATPMPPSKSPKRGTPAIPAGGKRPAGPRFRTAAGSPLPARPTPGANRRSIRPRATLSGSSTADCGCSCSRWWTCPAAGSTCSRPWPGCSSRTAATFRPPLSCRTWAPPTSTGCSGWGWTRCSPNSPAGTRPRSTPRSQSTPAPSTLADPGCPEFVEEALARHSIAPGRLVLELLETETTEWDLLSEPLHRLVDLGVGVAMDDLAQATAASSGSRCCPSRR